MFDLETQAVETNDVDGAQGGIRAHQQASPPCGMNDGHKTDEQPRWTPQQINNTIAKSDVAFAVNRTGNLLHRSGICKQGLELYFLAIGLRSRVPLCVHEAERNMRIFPVSCRSAMNFARESRSEEPMRNSGSVWRKAFATTNSDGGMPGRMVRSQDPNESQTSLGETTARYWSNPWEITPACMKT